MYQGGKAFHSEGLHQSPAAICELIDYVVHTPDITGFLAKQLGGTVGFKINPKS